MLKISIPQSSSGRLECSPNLSSQTGTLKPEGSPEMGTQGSWKQAAGGTWVGSWVLLTREELGLTWAEAIPKEVRILPPSLD